MRLGQVKARDIVLAEVRGDRFYALVTEPVVLDRALGRRVLRVSSLTGRPIPARSLSAKQVIAHWRRAAGSRD